jgi:hypothetical protein
VDAMRKEYRELTATEAGFVQDVKDFGEAFVSTLYEIKEGGPSTASTTPLNRELAIAKTKIEEAVMWAVKGITGA